MLVTCDCAGSTQRPGPARHRAQCPPRHQVHYSVGFDFDERIRAVLPVLPRSAWTPALDADGNPRPDAQVAGLTGLLRHSVRAAGRVAAVPARYWGPAQAGVRVWPDT